MTEFELEAGVSCIGELCKYIMKIIIISTFNIYKMADGVAAIGLLGRVENASRRTL